MHAHTPARPSACIPGVHARNWEFRGANTLVLQRLLSFVGVPWDPLGHVCHQSYTIKAKAGGGAVISHGRAGEVFGCVQEMTLTPSEGAAAPLSPPSLPLAVPSGFAIQADAALSASPGMSVPITRQPARLCSTPCGSALSSLEVTWKALR